jgi:hypothetical protein
MAKRSGKFPQTINGITYQTQEELDERVRADAEGLAHIAYDMYQIHKQFEARLEREPGGYAFPADGRICKLCMGGGSGDFWYDKKGMRCMDCQTAYIKKVIPSYVFTDRDNKRHITETSLVVRYNAEHKEIRKYIKDGVLKARRIDHGRYPPTLVFLKRENPNLSVFTQSSN